MSILLIFSLLASYATTVHAVPNNMLLSANCPRPITVGTTIMGQAAISDSSKSIVVKRNGVQLGAGSFYVPGEILTISLSDTTNILYLFNVDNGAFKTAGGCGQTRVANSAKSNTPVEMEFIAPASGAVTISSAWDTANTFPVKITPTFLLSAPTATPSDAPTDSPTDTPTVKPSPVPSTAPTLLPICQYGGYCASDSDCVKGNKCSIQNQYYSQCIPDESTYKSGNCKKNWGDKCSTPGSSAECCDPGAICKILISIIILIIIINNYN